MGRISHARLRVLALALALALPMPGGVASAYWTGSAQSNTSAMLATLPAPTIVSATAGAETVELSWSAIVAPGAGTVEYYVSRDGGTVSAGCPGSSSPSIRKTFAAGIGTFVSSSSRHTP